MSQPGMDCMQHLLTSMNIRTRHKLWHNPSLCPIFLFRFKRDELTQEGQWLLNGYNCTQTGPSVIEWSTTEDTSENTVANQSISSDADNIQR
jgi:hypothetical protein